MLVAASSFAAHFFLSADFAKQNIFLHINELNFEFQKNCLCTIYKMYIITKLYMYIYISERQ